MNPNYSQGRYTQREHETRAMQHGRGHVPQSDPDRFGGRGYDSGSHDAYPDGRFDVQRLSINLIMLALLGGIIVGALVFLADVLVARFSGGVPFGMTFAVLSGLAAGLGGVAIGLIYIPVMGSGSENLYGIAISVLTVVIAIVTLVFGGLLDGVFTSLVWMTLLIGVAAIALATPGRIEAAAL